MIEGQITPTDGFQNLASLSWGSHVCQFYSNSEELLQVVVPYFKSGFDQNQACLWVVPDQKMNVAEATESLKSFFPDILQLIKSGSLEIISSKVWYGDFSTLDADAVLNKWKTKLQKKLHKGFAGLRVVAGIYPEKNAWALIMDYEHRAHVNLVGMPIMGICAYPTERCKADKVIEVVQCHHRALIKRGTQWADLESVDRQSTQVRLRDSKSALETKTHELEQTQENFRNIVEKSPDGILILGPTGRVLFANAAVDVFLGSGTYEKIVGESKPEFLSSTSKEQVFHPDSRSSVTAEIRVTPTQWQKGEAFLVTLRDMTSRKIIENQLRESERKLRVMTEVMPTLLWTSRPDGSVDFVNQRMCEEIGRPMSTFLDWGWKDSLHPDDQERCFATWTEASRLGMPYEVEVRHFNAPTGTYRWFRCRAVPLRDPEGQVVKWLGCCHDIHDHRLITEELQRLNRVKSEITATVSHELKTPLGAIKAALELTLDQVDGTINDDQKETLTIAYNNVKRLSRLIRNVLDYSKIEASQLQLCLAEVNLNGLLQESLDLIKMTLDHSKKLILEMEPVPHPVKAIVDADKLKQIVINLLDNAVKFTPDHGRITLGLRQEEGQAAIEVKDTGVGIRPQDQEVIFEMYGQSLGEATHVANGAGVGLAVCKKLVELHQGDISVSSELGKGSCFTIRFPQQGIKNSLPRSS